MPVDNVSELNLVSTADNSAANTGRRRQRRTTGASSGQNTNQPPVESLMTPRSFPPAPVRSPLMESLDNLTEDITDIPAGGHLPSIRLPPKPTRAVAPLPLATTPATQSAAPATGDSPFFYVQKGRAFKKTKGWPAMFYSKRSAGIGSGDLKEQTAAEEQRQAENELLEVGLIVQRIQQTTGTIICGFLAGLTTWYAIAGQLLFSNLVPQTDTDYLKSEAFAIFVIFYQAMSMPVGCVFYLLLAFCLLTIFDRYDISFATRKDVLQALRLQNGAIPLIILYLAALVVTLVCAQHDARIYAVTNEKLKPPPLTTTSIRPMTDIIARGVNFSQLFQTSTPQLLQPLTNPPGPPLPPMPMGSPLIFYQNNNNQFETTTATKEPEPEPFDINELDQSVTIWLRLNFARAACCVVAWLVLAITSDPDRMSRYLTSMMEGSSNSKPITPQQNAPAIIIAAPAPPSVAIPQSPMPINAALESAHPTPDSNNNNQSAVP